MEKAKVDKETRPKAAKKGVLWDCGSTLYDSFELKSFERQLDAAIASSRTLSMPHLPDRRLQLRQPPPPPAKQQPARPTSRYPFKLPRSLRKLLRSVFRPKRHVSGSDNFGRWFHVVKGSVDTPSVYFVYDTSGALSTIPEAPEAVDGHSPEMKPLTRRTASDRFAPAALGIYFA